MEETKALLEKENEQFKYEQYPFWDFSIIIFLLVLVIISGIDLYSRKEKENEDQFTIITKNLLIIVGQYFLGVIIFCSLRSYLLLDWAQISKKDYEIILGSRRENYNYENLKLKYPNANFKVIFVKSHFFLNWRAFFFVFLFIYFFLAKCFF